MKLSDLLPPDAECEPRFADLDVTGISADSRKVMRGGIFAALAGSRTDGARFVADALGKGAVAVLAEQAPSMPLPADIALVRTPNARRALALIAARFHPQQPQTIAAVTGTSGKTSVAAFLSQIWHALGFSSASIGTIGVASPRGEIYGSLTTPDPVALQSTVETLARDGVTHLAIEASSHGLDQHRLDGLRVTVGGYTNLSRDHLDYHPTMEAYLAAKLRLFTELLPSGSAAVVNADDEHAPAVIAAAEQRGLDVMTVGRKGVAITLRRIARDGFGERIDFEFRGRSFTKRVPLVGGFQVENALLAGGMAIASGGEPEQAFAAIETLKGAKGRLELAGTFRGAPIFIDYAHKPDALAKTLDALRPYVRGRLVVLFGAGGDREKGKRPLMGAIAADKADHVIVTDDNPRTEDPAAIRAAILAAAPGATEIGDRTEAIHAAVAALEPGDVLVVAGKGHETGQIVGDRVLPFTDHDAVAAALKGKAA
jgi:UDP-N-acetylmuramoyl-L-alanyl-D-glutamate--2,6-diaminopimelate ligase